MLARHWPLLAYAAVTLAIAYPLLGPGYVFALDHAMGPRGADYYNQYVVDNSHPIQSKGGYGLLLALLELVMPAWLAQKVILFLPFLLAGLGMHRLLQRHLGIASGALALMGGLLFTLSPFAYLRGVSGQTGVLWAYALTPWFLAAWLRATGTGRWRDTGAAVLLFTLTAVFQAHGAFLLALLAGLHTLLRAAAEPRQWRAVLAVPARFALAALLVNAYWLAPVLLAQDTTLHHLVDEDRSFFATTDSGLPSVGLAALTLQGFWRDGHAGPYDTTPLLLVVPAAVLLLAVQGFLSRPKDTAARTVAAAGLLGFALAVGTASPLTAPLFNLAWDHVPFFKGFRDSHKFLALLALAYAALAPHGARALLDLARGPPATGWVRPAGAAALAALLVAAPFAAAAPLLGGFDGQLRVGDYPQEWAEAEAATRDCDGALLVLPWHMYLDLAWVPNVDKRVTNPAKLYFTCPVIAGDNIEAGGIGTQSTSPVSRYVEHWLHDEGLARGNPEGLRTFGNLLAPLDVAYVLVLKEADWRPVNDALARQRDLEPVLDTPRLVLYRNLAYDASAGGGGGVGAGAAPPEHTVEDWSGLRDLSEREPLAGARIHVRQAPPVPEPPVAPAEAPMGALQALAWAASGLALAGLAALTVREARARPLRQRRA